MEDFITTCRVCGCTDLDFSNCIEKTGEPCSWYEPGLCSACADEIREVSIVTTLELPYKDFSVDVSVKTEITEKYKDDEIHSLSNRVLEAIGIKNFPVKKINYHYL